MPVANPYTPSNRLIALINNTNHATDSTIVLNWPNCTNQPPNTSTLVMPTPLIHNAHSAATTCAHSLIAGLRKNLGCTKRPNSIPQRYQRYQSTSHQQPQKRITLVQHEQMRSHDPQRHDEHNHQHDPLALSIHAFSVAHQVMVYRES